MPKPRSVFALGLPATLLAALTLAVLIPATASAQPASEECGTATIVLEGGQQPFELPRQRNETLKVRRDSTLKISVINVPPGDALGDALTALGCPIIATQREMLLRLD